MILMGGDEEHAHTTDKEHSLRLSTFLLMISTRVPYIIYIYIMVWSLIVTNCSSYKLINTNRNTVSYILCSIDVCFIVQ